MHYYILLQDGSRWMRADLSLDCDAPLHSSMQIYAFLSICVYTLGTPFLFGYLFFFKVVGTVSGKWVLQQQRVRSTEWAARSKQAASSS